MTEVELPDGTIIEFPDGMSREQIAEVLRRRYGSQTPEQPKPNPDGTYGQVPEGMFLDPRTGSYTSRELMKGNMQRGQFDALTSGAAQGLFSSFADELAGAIGGDVMRERVRAATELDREQFPKTSMAGEVGAAVAAPGAAIGAARGLPMAARIGAGATAGGVQGALYGAGADEGTLSDRMDGAKRGGVVGALFGGAAPVVGQVAKNIYDSRAARQAMQSLAKSAPSLDDLKAMATRIYTQADNVNNLPRGQFAPAAQGMLNQAQRSGMDPMLTPQAARVMDNITDAATSPDPTIGFRELDTLRRQAQIPAGDVGNRTQSALGSQMTEGIDDFVSSVDPNLGQQIGAAREMWSRLRRSEAVNEIIDRAKLQASGFENGLRIGFRSLLNNPKAVRGFSEAERAAMREIVEGTTFGNVMKKVGKIGFGLSQQSNMLGGGLAAAGGASAGSTFGPLGAAAGAVLPGAIGYVAQRASERMTANAANRLSGAIRGGGVQSVPQLTPQVQGLFEDAIRRMGAGTNAYFMPTAIPN